MAVLYKHGSASGAADRCVGDALRGDRSGDETSPLMQKPVKAIWLKRMNRPRAANQVKTPNCRIKKPASERGRIVLTVRFL